MLTGLLLELDPVDDMHLEDERFVSNDLIRRSSVPDPKGLDVRNGRTPVMLTRLMSHAVQSNQDGSI